MKTTLQDFTLTTLPGLQQRAIATTAAGVYVVTFEPVTPVAYQAAADAIAKAIDAADNAPEKIAAAFAASCACRRTPRAKCIAAPWALPLFITDVDARRQQIRLPNVLGASTLQITYAGEGKHLSYAAIARAAAAAAGAADTAGAFASRLHDAADVLHIIVV